VAAEAAAQAPPAAADAAEAKAPSGEPPAKPTTSDSAATAASEAPATDAEALKLPSFQQVMADAQVSSIDLLRDVELNVKIELGRAKMLVDEVLKLGEGSVVELDKLAGDPVDVFVNDRLVARGEVLVLNDNFCVRVNEIVPGAKEEAM
jgi:flagellar motor switch protein FliN/FliY